MSPVPARAAGPKTISRDGFLTSDRRVAAILSWVSCHGWWAVTVPPPCRESPPMKIEFRPYEGRSLMPPA